MLRRYIPGVGVDETVVWYEGAGFTDRRFLIADERGSVISVSDSSGAALATNTYDEYGRPGALNAGRFQYTGQAWISELGLYYYKARFYSPELKRFLQPDPIGYAGGMNLYGYVGGDPVNMSDPSGTDSQVETPTDEEVIVTGKRPKKVRSSALANPAARTGNGRAIPGSHLKTKKKKKNKDKDDPEGEDVIICHGKARVLAGNPDNLGKQGGFPGVTITPWSAGIIPRQFTGQNAAGPVMRSIGARAWGVTIKNGFPSQFFFAFTETVGGEVLSKNSITAQDIIMERDPGLLVLELISGSDEGVVDIVISIPATEHGCPEGTAPQ